MVICITYVRERGITMTYSKPKILSSEQVKMAVCGSGPCGRPCTKKA